MNDDHVRSWRDSAPDFALPELDAPSADEREDLRRPASPNPKSVRKLEPRFVEKPWGRTRLPPPFANAAGKRIGEIWLGNDGSLPLLAKYLFTSENLSIQVHPDDQQAKLRGFGRGKSECWLILDAEPEAVIGLGLRREVAEDELRAAALDGSIEKLIDWRPVKAGDFFYVSAGTIHAIGGGISLLEFQQNSGATFRLYDYGRERSLHLDDAVAVANRGPYVEPTDHFEKGDNRILVSGPHFRVVHCHSDCLRDRRRWILPLEGRVTSAGQSASPGECMLLEAGDGLETDNARMLIGAVA